MVQRDAPSRPQLPFLPAGHLLQRQKLLLLLCWRRVPCFPVHHRDHQPCNGARACVRLAEHMSAAPACMHARMQRVRQRGACGAGKVRGAAARRACARPADPAPRLCALPTTCIRAGHRGLEQDDGRRHYRVLLDHPQQLVRWFIGRLIGGWEGAGVAERPGPTAPWELWGFLGLSSVTQREAALLPPPPAVAARTTNLPPRSSTALQGLRLGRQGLHQGVREGVGGCSSRGRQATSQGWL